MASGLNKSISTFVQSKGGQDLPWSHATVYAGHKRSRVGCPGYNMPVRGQNTLCLTLYCSQRKRQMDRDQNNTGNDRRELFGY